MLLQINPKFTLRFTDIYSEAIQLQEPIPINRLQFDINYKKELFSKYAEIIAYGDNNKSLPISLKFDSIKTNKKFKAKTTDTWNVNYIVVKARQSGNYSFRISINSQGPLSSDGEILRKRIESTMTNAGNNNFSNWHIGYMPGNNNFNRGQAGFFLALTNKILAKEVYRFFTENLEENSHMNKIGFYPEDSPKVNFLFIELNRK